MESLLQLGIDPKAILVYMINVGLLTVVLWYFLYNPIISFLEKRQKTIKDAISEADNIKTQLEQSMAEMEAQKAAAQANLKAELDKMEALVESRKAELTKAMEDERVKLISKATADIEQRKAELVKEIEQDLLKVIKDIILEIVHNKVPADVIQGSVNEAWDKYKK